MTPEAVAALWEDQVLGQALAGLILATMIALIVWAEWIASAQDRKRQRPRKFEMGERRRVDLALRQLERESRWRDTEDLF